MAADRTPGREDLITWFFRASALLDPVRLAIWDSQGLTVTQLRLLFHLYEREGMSNAELAEAMYVTRPSISALLDRLERRGFIRREISPDDRRGIRIFLEPAGREAVTSLRPAIRRYVADLIAELSDDEVAAIARSLERLVQAGRRRQSKKAAEGRDV
ncbi:MAG: MarR family transcriptional regulator [Chloroflexota bacterium]|jgi:DNA-binding MarR family transcriptional regulator|nr:MarR family transcriptional regulator [Dehalococcoidia bacterium]MDW8045738.1 MarR family transcriptional regulator [Chloroflexota bacterium]